MWLGFADAISQRERSDDRKCACCSQAKCPETLRKLFRALVLVLFFACDSFACTYPIPISCILLPNIINKFSNSR